MSASLVERNDLVGHPGEQNVLGLGRCIAATNDLAALLHKMEHEEDPALNFLDVAGSAMLTKLEGSVAEVGVEIDFVVATLASTKPVKEAIHPARRITQIGQNLTHTLAKVVIVGPAGDWHERIDLRLELRISLHDLLYLLRSEIGSVDMYMETTGSVDFGSRYIESSGSPYRLINALVATQNGRDGFPTRVVMHRGILNELPVGGDLMGELRSIVRLNLKTLHQEGLTSCLSGDPEGFDLDSEAAIGGGHDTAS